MSTNRYILDCPDEVARRVRSALGSAVRLVALTGYGSPDERQRA